MASIASVLLHKTTQGRPVRSSLNSRFTDLKELEYEMRRRVMSPKNLSVHSLVGDHYAQLRGSLTSFQHTAIPLKHLRTSQSQVSMYLRRGSSRSKPVTPRITLPLDSQSALLLSRSPDSVKPSSHRQLSFGSMAVVKTVTFAGDTPRPTLKNETFDKDLKDTWGPTVRGVKTARKQVRRMKRKVTKGFKACSRDIDKALNVDLRGYVPKSLQEYKEKKAEFRRLAGKTTVTSQGPVINIRKEVVRQYKSDLVSKALARGVDKDLRYIYTFGSLSSVEP